MNSNRIWFLLAFIFLCLNTAFSQRKGTGFVFDLPSLRGTPYKAKLTMKSYKDMPSSASLEKYCPTPGDQGQYGTCVAFAAGYHLRTILWAKQYKVTDKSTIDQALFSPTYIYEQIKEEGDLDCLGGSNPVDAFELMLNMGVASIQTVPYACGGEVGFEAMLEGMDFRISDYQVLFYPEEGDNSQKINSVKKALAEGYPVLLGFTVPESFYESGPLWEPKETDGGPSGQHGLHAMCIVGYDDAKHGGAFRILNSWGTGWADGGFFWVKYDDFAKWSLVALQAYPPAVVEEEPVVDNDPPTPTPSPTPNPPKPEPLPTPEPADVVLSGNVEFVTNTGNPMPAGRVLTRNLTVEDDDEPEPYKEDLVAYRMNNAYPSGTKFRFFITTNTESYIYAFATDLTGKVNKLLPFDDNMSPHIGPNSQVAFPSEKKVVKMDANPGTDYMLILYSPEPLDANWMLSQMNATRGGLSAKIHAALGDKLMLPSDVKYRLNEIGFDVKGAKTGTVVPLMVEIAHE
ncbi:MAG: DUF4384 domain-containing protein [Saprospiraceae bacterium]|nr:DUF4384 domain-containing protein [Saprospiraceae bacterium]